MGEEESKVISRFLACTTGWRSSIFEREDYEFRAKCKEWIYFEMRGSRCPVDGHYVFIGSIGYGELSCIDQRSSLVWKFL